MACIRKRGNSYTIIVSCGYDFSGKKLTESATFVPDPAWSEKRIEKEVAAFAADFERKVKDGAILDGRKITFAQFADKWLDEYAAENLTHGAIANYKNQLRLILPALGHFKLNEIKPAMINSFFVSLSKPGSRIDGKPGGYSKGTIQKTKVVLSSILSTATSWELIQSNPCEKVSVKTEATSETLKFFTPEQLAAFLEYIELPYTVTTKAHERIDDTGGAYRVDTFTRELTVPLQLRVLFNLAVFSGLRKGEILALQWSDVDFENDTVSVSKSATVVNHEQIIKEPKTRNSRRVISIPHFLTLRLHELKIEQTKYRLSVGEFWQGNDWVFTQADGRMMNYSTPYESMQRIIERYNTCHTEQLPLIPFHGLRHSHATLLIASNQDLRTVSSRMGHASASTTLSVYSHALRENDKAAAEMLASVVLQKRDKHA